LFYIEDLIEIVRWLALIVALIDLALVVFILYRRVSRNRYYARKDAAHREFSGVVSQFASGSAGISDAIAVLRRARTPARIAAVQELLLAAITAENRERMTELLFQLGYIKMWVVQAFGRRRAGQLLSHIAHGKDHPSLQTWKRHFPSTRRLRVFAIARALPVAHFSHLAAKFSEVLVAEALRDPSPYVTGLAVAALGKHLSPVAVPILLEQLRQAVEGQSELPARAVKTALVRHSIDHLREFLPFLGKGEDRFRLLVVDTIREMLNAERSVVTAKDLPPEMYDWFLQKAVRDASSDVRARSAAVIGHFHDDNSVVALRALLSDDNEYVRLHAVRACADPYYAELVDGLVACMTDPRWRVREAAAKALARIRNTGAQRLADCFLATNDRYASEQIADELQRSGLILQLVSTLDSLGDEAKRAAAVCAKIAGLGMTALFADLLLREPSVPIRTRLMELLAIHPDPRVTAALRKIALKADDPLKHRAEGLLQSAAANAPAAAGE
jgi:HEAT repeat protein